MSDKKDYWDGAGIYHIFDGNGVHVATEYTRRKADDKAVELSGGLYMTAMGHYVDEIL